MIWLLMLIPRKSQSFMYLYRTTFSKQCPCINIWNCFTTFTIFSIYKHEKSILHQVYYQQYKLPFIWICFFFKGRILYIWLLESGSAGFSRKNLQTSRKFTTLLFCFKEHLIKKKTQHFKILVVLFVFQKNDNQGTAFSW